MKKMNCDQHLVSLPWSDYELLDSGDNMKLERFGAIIVARPETQALWGKQHPELWEKADAVFAFRDKKGAWNVRTSVSESWELSWKDVRFLARLSGFKHTGVFPEQAPNWEWIAGRVRAVSQRLGTVSEGVRNRSHAPTVLNLFGYTGVASLVAAHAGAFVTHVDASKQSLDWAHENARLSNIPEESVRWILDDALAFAKREARRGTKYDGIILDPPAFGRGAKGEVWKIEEDLPVLLDALKDIFSDAPGSFFLLNGYAAGYASRSFAQAIESTFGEVDGGCGELYIKEAQSERVIPAGVSVRFVR
ncbi:MAG: class I SAM-dependent methyltransferase [Minisyncoccota bacterium]